MKRQGVLEGWGCERGMKNPPSETERFSRLFQTCRRFQDRPQGKFSGPWDWRSSHFTSFLSSEFIPNFCSVIYLKIGIIINPPKKQRSVLNLLLARYSGDSSNPNFYNIVGIICWTYRDFFWDPGRKRGRILRQIQFVWRTTDAGGAQNILLWSFECPIHAYGVELHFNGPFCYLQKYSDPLPCSTTRQIFKKP